MTNTTSIVRRVRTSGERLTKPRMAVIEALCALSDHATIQTIQTFLEQQGIDAQESTTYRVLQWLKGLGLVAQTDLGQSGITYQLISSPPHHHLVCLHCGTVQDVDDSFLDGLRQEVRTAFAFEPRIDHMAIFGVCQNCADNTVPVRAR